MGRCHQRAEGGARDHLVPGSVQSISLEAEHKNPRDPCLLNSYTGRLAFKTSSSNAGSWDRGQQGVPFGSLTGKGRERRPKERKPAAPTPCGCIQATEGPKLALGVPSNSPLHRSGSEVPFSPFPLFHPPGRRGKVGVAVSGHPARRG